VPRRRIKKPPRDRNWLKKEPPKGFGVTRKWYRLSDRTDPSRRQ
jgi:hypothetical protein